MATITIAGTLYSDEGVTPITAGCTLAVSVNGAAAVLTAVTSVVDGTYLTTGLTSVAGDVLTVYIQDAVNTQVAVTVTRSTGANMTGIDLYQNYLNLRSDDGTALTGTNLNTSDNNGATGISAIYSANSNTAFTLIADKTLYIMSGQSFTPGGAWAAIIRGSWKNKGTYTQTAGSVTFQSTTLATATIDCGGTLLFTPSFLGSSTVTYTLTGNFLWSGSLTLGNANATFDVSASNYSMTSSGISGGFSQTAGTFNARSGTVTIGGTAAANISVTTAAFYNLTKTAAASSTLNSNLTVTNNLTISGGTLSLNGHNITLTGATFTNSAILQLQGGETLTGFTNDTANGGTVTYVGTGTTSYTGLIAGNSYANLKFNGSGRTWTLNHDVTVSSTLTRTAGTVVDGGFAINVAGNWTNTAGAGAFTLTGTTTLNGTNQTISGNTTFYNLTKTVAAADTLTFTDGTTQTVTNSLTLNGASGQLLTLTGTSTGGWTISCPATQSLTYVKPDHSTATTNTAAAGTGSVDGGNNTNWSFPSADPFPASYLRIQQFYFLPDVDSSWWSGQQIIKSQLPPIQQPIPIIQQQLLLESCDVQQQIRQQPVLVTPISGPLLRQQLQDSNNWIQPEFSYRTVSSLVAFTIPTQSRPTTVPEYQKENIDWWYEQPRTIIVQASIPSAVLSWSGITQTTMQQSGISSTIMQKVGATSTSLSWVGRTL